MWRPIAQSLQGPSHSLDNSPCQDSHELRVLDGDIAQTLVACVADGAGSSKFSDVGSGVACRSIVFSAVSFLESGGRLEDLQRDDVIRWCNLAREHLFTEARSRECEMRELATTICAAIVSPHYSCFFQIGDGAMVLRRHGVYGVVFWPQTGEYANSTNFLTASNFDKQLEFASVNGACTDIALFTDGLERLALRFDDQTPHVPFFDPFFRALRAAANVDGLNASLLTFLGSASVRDRSDDDKTLILASHIAQ